MKVIQMLTPNQKINALTAMVQSLAADEARRAPAARNATARKVAARNARNAALLDDRMTVLLVAADTMLNDLRNKVDALNMKVNEGDPTLNWSDAEDLAWIVMNLRHAVNEED